jgi:hypothetical protein
VPRPSATDPETLVRFADYRISRVCQPRQAGSLLKERSAIVRAVCLMTLLTQSRTRRVRSRSYFAPEPASRTRPVSYHTSSGNGIFSDVFVDKTSHRGGSFRHSQLQLQFAGSSTLRLWGRISRPGLGLVASPTEQLCYMSCCSQRPIPAHPSSLQFTKNDNGS